MAKTKPARVKLRTGFAARNGDSVQYTDEQGKIVQCEVIDDRDPAVLTIKRKRGGAELKVGRAVSYLV